MPATLSPIEAARVTEAIRDGVPLAVERQGLSWIATCRPRGAREPERVFAAMDESAFQALMREAEEMRREAARKR